MRKVLIVDDEPSVRFVLGRTCERAGVAFEEAGSAEEAREKLRALGGGRDGVGLVLLDIRLPGDDGFKLLGEIGGRTDSPFIVVMTAEDTMRSAVEAMKRGAADYLGKPFDLARVERLVKDLAAAPAGPRRARPRSARAPAGIEAEIDPNAEPRRYRDISLPETLIGRSAAMIEVYKEIGRVARTEMTVLLMGESGTGKELVARAIHANSTRSRGPFITVNMAAIPKDLIESELYGHEKGSFTGAVERRPGKFELASGGTLFLDEIGEMPIELQAKLLRVLQEREVDRVGGTRPLAVDVRIVAATNADLGRSVEEGRFRRDLYYRLAVVPIRLPPLREREGDVILLARHFLAKYGEQLKGRAARAREGRRAAAPRAPLARQRPRAPERRPARAAEARRRAARPRRTSSASCPPRACRSAGSAGSSSRSSTPPRPRAAGTRRRSPPSRRRSSRPRSRGPAGTSSAPPSSSG